MRFSISRSRSHYASLVFLRKRARVRARSQSCEFACSAKWSTAATMMTMMTTVAAVVATATEMVATATAVVATATAAATTARSRSMAQCHFARAPRPCSPHSSPPTPTLTICPHRAPSRGAEKACPAPQRRTSALPSFLASSRPPTFAPFHFILHLLCSSSSSVFFLCFEFSLDIAFFTILRGLFFFKRSFRISVSRKQPKLSFSSIASEILILILNTSRVLSLSLSLFILYTLFIVSKCYEKILPSNSSFILRMFSMS